MSRLRKYRSGRIGRSVRILQNPYIRIVGAIVVVVAVASFYIYQRVWVRNLVEEIDGLQNRNIRIGENLASIKSEWMAASSIANIEARIGEFRLALEPARPSQNFTLRPPAGGESDRYAGLIKAFEKLKGSIPLVSSNEADAGELFEEE